MSSDALMNIHEGQRNYFKQSTNNSAMHNQSTELPNIQQSEKMAMTQGRENFNPQEQSALLPIQSDENDYIHVQVQDMTRVKKKGKGKRKSSPKSKVTMPPLTSQGHQTDSQMQQALHQQLNSSNQTYYNSYTNNYTLMDLAAASNQITGRQFARNQINIVAKKRPPSMPIKNHEEFGIDPKRKVLYRNFHEIEKKIYLVEISRNAHKVFIILFPNFEAPDIFISEVIPEKKAQKLMTDNNNMFEDLVAQFYIKYGKLQIAGYHGMAQDPRKGGAFSINSGRVT